MWALARYDLGLTDEQFGDLTYAMFEALIDRKKADDRRRFLLTGIVASTIVNMAGKQLEEGQDPSTPQDFMPPEEKEEELNMSPEAQAARIINSFSKKTYRHV